MHVLRDNGEDDAWSANYIKLSLRLGEFMFVVFFMFIPSSKLINYFISMKHVKLRAMTAGEDS